MLFKTDLFHWITHLPLSLKTSCVRAEFTARLSASSWETATESKVEEIAARFCVILLLPGTRWVIECTWGSSLASWTGLAEWRASRGPPSTQIAVRTSSTGHMTRMFVKRCLPLGDCSMKSCCWSQYTVTIWWVMSVSLERAKIAEVAEYLTVEHTDRAGWCDDDALACVSGFVIPCNERDFSLFSLVSRGKYRDS
jgi:hypothetical protein